jgi:hypothetical protein
MEQRIFYFAIAHHKMQTAWTMYTSHVAALCNMYGTMSFFAIARKGVDFVRLSFVARSLSLSLLHSLPFLVYKNTSILISPLSSTPHTHS